MQRLLRKLALRFKINDPVAARNGRQPSRLHSRRAGFVAIISITRRSGADKSDL